MSWRVGPDGTRRGLGTREVVGRALGGARPLESPHVSLSPPKSGRDRRLPWRQWRSGAPGLLQLLAPGSACSRFGSSGPLSRATVVWRLPALTHGSLVDGCAGVGGAGSSVLRAPPAPVLPPPFQGWSQALGSGGRGGGVHGGEPGDGGRSRAFALGAGGGAQGGGSATWLGPAAGAAPSRYPESARLQPSRESLLPRAVIFFSWGFEVSA